MCIQKQPRDHETDRPTFELEQPEIQIVQFFQIIEIRNLTRVRARMQLGVPTCTRALIKDTCNRIRETCSCTLASCLITDFCLRLGRAMGTAKSQRPTSHRGGGLVACHLTIIVLPYQHTHDHRHICYAHYICIHIDTQMYITRVLRLIHIDTQMHIARVLRLATHSQET